MCEDVDECELDSCDAKNSYGELISRCENQIGTYSCICNEGYLTGFKLTHLLRIYTKNLDEKLRQRSEFNSLI